MRESDGRLRRNVCIEVLRAIGGKPVDKAAAEVATLLLGRQTVGSVSRIRVDYYQRRPGCGDVDFFFSQFLNWRAWVFESSKERLAFIRRSYGMELGQAHRRKLSKLIQAIRRDPEQRARNRSWLLEPGEPQRSRIESHHWDPSIDWQFLATDLWTLGRLHAEIHELAKARALLERALNLWKTPGHHVAHRQVEALPALEFEIARLGAGQTLDAHASPENLN